VKKTTKKSKRAKAVAKTVKASYKCTKCAKVVSIAGLPKKCPGCGKLVYPKPDGTCPLCGYQIIVTASLSGDALPKKCPARCCGKDLTNVDLNNGRCPFCGAGAVCPVCGYDFRV